MTEAYKTGYSFAKESLVSQISTVQIAESPSVPGQKGVITLAAIEAGESIFQIRGPIGSEPTRYTFQVGPAQHLDPIDEIGEPSFGHFTNHSCNPSAYIKIGEHNGTGTIDVIARRDLKAGDEVHVDYAAMEFAPTAQGLECQCGSAECRHVITGYRDLSQAIKNKYIAEGIIPQYLQDLDQVQRS